MSLQQTFIEGNSKRIFSASPLQVSSLRKEYLRSLSPGKIPEVLVNSNLIKLKLPSLHSKIESFLANPYIESKRKRSGRHLKGLMRINASINTGRTKARISIKDKLRLNNL